MEEDKTLKQKLNQFVQVLYQNRSPENLFDNGLIIKEANSSIFFEDIKDNLTGFQEINPDNPVTFLKDLARINRQGQGALLKISQDLKPAVITHLKQLAENNCFTLLDPDNNSLKLKLNEKFRLIAFAERSVLENEITYPFVYNLFGPILSL